MHSIDAPFFFFGVFGKTITDITMHLIIYSRIKIKYTMHEVDPMIFRFKLALFRFTFHQILFESQNVPFLLIFGMF